MRPTYPGACSRSRRLQRRPAVPGTVRVARRAPCRLTSLHSSLPTRRSPRSATPCFQHAGANLETRPMTEKAPLKIVKPQPGSWRSSGPSGRQPSPASRRC